MHDHGFNNISTYGNLWRLMREGRIPFNEREMDFYELALKVSGAVQAARWTATGGRGRLHLFVQRSRTRCSWTRCARCGRWRWRTNWATCCEGSGTKAFPCSQRLLAHAETTARYSIYYGKGRDAFDVRGRTAHESIFNLNDGSYRCPNSQQGYSPFSTWTRGLAWAMLGYAEQLEFLDDTRWIGKAGHGAGDARADLEARRPADPRARDMAASARRLFLEAALRDGGLLPGQLLRGRHPDVGHGRAQLHRLGEYLAKPADPFNRWEPVDSSAAAIAAQGLVRLGIIFRPAATRSKATAIARRA